MARAASSTGFSVTDNSTEKDKFRPQERLK